MAEQRITLDDVARLSGVSRATASRALNHKDGVADDVRERVHLIAESLDYRPNRAAQSLAGGRSSVLGFVLGSDNIVTDRYTASLIQSAGKASSHFDEGLMLLMAKHAPGQAVRKLLRDGLVDGLVVRAAALGQAWVDELLDANVKRVLIGSHSARPDMPRVDTENRESTARLVEHLFATGCTRIATITGPLDRNDAAHRLEGFRLAHERRGIPVDESLVRHGDFSRSAGHRLTHELMPKGPDAIVAANDDMAAGVLSAAAQLGIDVPTELSVVGFDGTSRYEPLSAGLTTVVQPFDELALHAVRTLIDQINDKEVEHETLLTPALYFGTTTRAPDPAVLSELDAIELTNRAATPTTLPS